LGRGETFLRLRLVLRVSGDSFTNTSSLLATSSDFVNSLLSESSITALKFVSSELRVGVSDNDVAVDDDDDDDGGEEDEGARGVEGEERRKTIGESTCCEDGDVKSVAGKLSA